MKKVKILVVEDEVIIGDNICKALQDLGYEALEPAMNYSEAIERIEEEKPDIAILDIYLSGKKTGIDLAKKINESYNFPFIFLTANSDTETLNQAKEVMPHAYLLKPFSKNELFTSIEIALHNFSKNNGHINNDNIVIKDALFIKEKGLFTKVNFSDILFIKSAHVYVEIMLLDTRKFVSRSSLGEILDKLNTNFMRVHRGYIINIKYLTKVNQTSVEILNNTIPLSKKYKENIVKNINSV